MQPAIQVFTLGTFRVVVQGRVLDGGAWRRRQARQLFKALLSRPERRLLKDQAIELLWPDGDPEAGAANLRPTLTALRHALKPVQCVLADRDMVGLDPVAGLWVDADAFEEALALADSSPEPMRFLEQASALYLGDYLPDDLYEDWAKEDRERLKRAWASLQLSLVRLADERSDPLGALGALERLVAADSCDEAAAQELIRRHTRAGRRVEAMRVYERLVQALRAEVELEPSEATLELRRQIVGAEGPPVSSVPQLERPLSEPPQSRGAWHEGDADLAEPDPTGHSNRFASLEPAAIRSNRLPAEPTRLLGRVDQLAKLRKQLLSSDVRLVTLTGTGGSGKTRLAVALARDLRSSFRDGVVFVDLSPIRDASLVVLATAHAVGLQEGGRTAIADLLTEYLRERHTLLVLDNIEQVLAAAPELSDLLGECPGVKMLVTSRVALRVRWEHQAFVPPLALPDPAARDVEAIARSPAVALFVQRARAANGAFELTRENCQAVAAVCTALDGLPLALELAAARIRVLPPAVMLERLGSRLGLLRSGPRDAPGRHQSLRAAIDWSFELLNPVEQTLLRRLSVFVGGATLDAVERVCVIPAEGPSQVLDTLGALIDGSLVMALKQDGRTGQTVRFEQLETLREYGAEKQQLTAEATRIQASHAGYFLELAETAWPQLVAHDQRRWLDMLEREHDNLRAALKWFTAAGDTDGALRLAASLWRFWWLRGHLGEGQRWLEIALARAVNSAPNLRARVLEGAANLARVRGQLGHAATLAREDVALCRQVNDPAGLAQALIGAGNVAFDQSEWASANSLYREALGLKRRLGEKRGVAMALHNLAEVEYRLGSDTFGPMAEESLALFMDVGDRWGMALARNDLARVATHRGDFSRAHALYVESLGLLQELGDRWSSAECLQELAALAVTEDNPLRGASLLGLSDALRESVGGPRSTSDQVTYERLRKELRTRLGDEAFLAAWNSLQAVPITDVAERVLTAAESRGS